MGGGGNQHDVAAVLATRAVVGANHQEPREFALRPGIRLQRHRREAGDGLQRVLELRDDLRVAPCLIGRHERVQRREPGPGDRHHLGGHVQLHRAGPERDHRRVEPHVLALELLDVAHHLRLRPVPVEDRMRHERRGPAERLRQPARVDVHLERRRGLPGRRGERRNDVGHVTGFDGLVQRDAHVAIVVVAQVDAGGEGRLADGGGSPGAVHADRVEVGRVPGGEAQAGQGALERHGERVHAAGDPGEPLGPVVDGVEAGDVGEQGLRGADVRGGLLAPDVLLAGLQRHAERRLPVGVHRHADDAAGRLAHERLARGEERRMRAAVAHRHAEPLGAAQHHVGPHLARGREQGQGQQVGGHGHQHAGGSRLPHQP